jgi:hypothetical protein
MTDKQHEEVIKALSFAEDEKNSIFIKGMIFGITIGVMATISLTMVLNWITQ